MERIAYLDCLRGISMLMVIYCHVEQFCFGFKENELIGDIFSIVMLPIFFFVSGLCTPPRITWNTVIKRIRYVVVPTVVMFLLYIGFYYGGYSQFMKCIAGEYKFGYWFTIVLFEMNLIHYGVSLISRNRIVLWGSLLFMAVLLILIKDWDWYHNDAIFSGWFCLRLLAQHFPYYILGMICMQNKEVFHKLLSNEYLVGGMILAFVALYIYPNGGFNKALLMGAFGTAIAYKICQKNQEYFSNLTTVGRMLIIIGRNTLPIYLIHYFFFIGLRMPWIKDHFNIVEQSWLIVAIAVLVTVAVAFASLLVKKLISLSKPLQYIMLGK